MAFVSHFQGLIQSKSSKQDCVAKKDKPQHFNFLLLIQECPCSTIMVDLLVPVWFFSTAQQESLSIISHKIGIVPEIHIHNFYESPSIDQTENVFVKHFPRVHVFINDLLNLNINVTFSVQDLCLSIDQIYSTFIYDLDLSLILTSRDEIVQDIGHTCSVQVFGT